MLRWLGGGGYKRISYLLPYSSISSISSGWMVQTPLRSVLAFGGAISPHGIHGIHPLEELVEVCRCCLRNHRSTSCRLMISKKGKIVVCSEATSMVFPGPGFGSTLPSACIDVSSALNPGGD